MNTPEIITTPTHEGSEVQASATTVAAASLVTLESLQAEINSLKQELTAKALQFSDTHPTTAPPPPASAPLPEATFAGENFGAPIPETNSKKVPLYLENPINSKLKEKFLAEN